MKKYITTLLISSFIFGVAHSLPTYARDDEVETQGQTSSTLRRIERKIDILNRKIDNLNVDEGSYRVESTVDIACVKATIGQFDSTRQRLTAIESCRLQADADHCRVISEMPNIECYSAAISSFPSESEKESVHKACRTRTYKCDEDEARRDERGRESR